MVTYYFVIFFLYFLLQLKVYSLLLQSTKPEAFTPNVLDMSCKLLLRFKNGFSFFLVIIWFCLYQTWACLDTKKKKVVIFVFPAYKNEKKKNPQIWWEFYSHNVKQRGWVSIIAFGCLFCLFSKNPGIPFPEYLLLTQK